MGSSDQRGRVRSSPEPPRRLAAEPKPSQGGGEDRGDARAHSSVSVDREGIPEARDDQDEDRGISEILHLRQCVQLSAGANEYDDRTACQHDGRDEGGALGDEARAPPEGSEGQCLHGERLFQHDREVSPELWPEGWDPSVTPLSSHDPSDSDCLGPGGSLESVLPLSQKLSDSEKRHVETSVDHMLPEALQSLVIGQRSMLLEVACSPNSVLTTTMQELTKNPNGAHRCSLWNGCDLGTGKGVKTVLDTIDMVQLLFVWLSPVCGPYSIMQNINQRSEAQRAELSEKRREALKQYVGCAIIYRYCCQRGIHVGWEWSQTCTAWRLPLIEKLKQEYQPYLSTVRGCQVNLRDDDQQFTSKGWKVMSTHELLAKRLDLPCRCSPGTVHVPCEGKLTERTAYYTKEFAKRVCQSILKGMSTETIHREIHQGKTPQGNFGFGTECMCHEGQHHDAHITCGHCTQHDWERQLGKDEHMVLAAHKTPGSSKYEGLPVEEIKRKLYLLHAATGHGPIKNLVRMLKHYGAPKEVLVEAEKFQCSVCQERSRPQPRNQATLEIQPKKLEVIEADVGHWVHPDGNHYQFLLYVDSGSRFKVARHIITGKRDHVTAAQFITTFRECWVEYFGNPRTLRVDPDGAFRSHELSSYCDANNIFLDIMPGEAHWKLSLCERGIQGVKELLSKMAQDFPDVSFVDLLSEAIRVFNSREQIRGYSPVQHLMGRAPDDEGRFFAAPRALTEDLCCEGPREENVRSHQLRQQAEMRFIEWTGQQRLSRAQNSKAKIRPVYHPGDLVYIWRRQVPLKEAKNKHGTGRFIGPARILATERERDADGALKTGSSIWLVRGRRLLKCCVEQLRHASQREHILQELYDAEPQPWDFPRVAKELGGNDYDDLTEEPPTPEELRRAADPDQEVQPSKRLRQKSRPPPGQEVTPAQATPDLATGSSSSSRPGRSRSRVGRSGPSSQASFVEGAHWTELVHDTFPAEPEVSGFWTEPTAAVSVSIDMPTTRSQTEKILKDLPTYFNNTLKKRAAVEVSEKYLTPAEQEEFRNAKGIEVSNFLAAKAFEALPSHLKVDRTRAVRMRWILTWKQKEDGTRKAKARAVLLGYMDPLYEHRSTASPTTTRQTRQMQLAIAAALGFTTEKGDVTGAFLQSRPYPAELTCVPCEEICVAMGLEPNSVVRVKKACYGLVDAPLEWYRSICDFFQKLGLRRLWSDPCCWVLERNNQVRGLISGHVDDFLFSGSKSDPLWQETCAAIRSEFKWSDWEHGKYTQCGVLVEEHSDGTYSLSQESYIDDLRYINLRAHRRKEKGAPTDALEQSQLRTLLGGLSWVAQQTAPHLAAEVGLLLSEVNHSSVDTINRANRLLDQAKGMKDHKVRIHKIPLDKMMVCAWCDAAAHNRPDGSSTQGIVVGISSTDLIKGQCAPVSLVMWQSAKIGRICRSPGASEAIAAVNAEDLLFFARFQLSEMSGHKVHVRQVNHAVNTVPGCLVTDSRNVYDKLASEAVVPKGAERRTDLELMSLKAAQLRNHVLVRWVNSEAQLANPLTKAREQREMMLFYRMNHHWKIVEDETMSSAKKRKLKGQSPTGRY